MKNYLDKKYWQSFIDKNENFTTTCVLKDSFSNEDRDTLYNGVTETLYKRIHDKILDNGFRLYFEGDELNKVLI